MAHPYFAFRLPREERETLRQVAKTYGAPNVSVFLRDMIGALAGKDEARSKAFYERLMKGAVHQLELDLENQAKANVAKKAAVRSPNRTKRKKGGRRGRPA